MNICFLLSNLGIGGAERQLLTLAIGLSQSHTVTIITCKGGPFLETLQQKNIKIIHIKKIFLIQFLPFFYYYLRKENIDCLITFNPIFFISSVILKCFIPKLKVLWEVRGDIGYLKFAKGRFSKNRLIYSLVEKLAPAADAIVANTQKATQYLNKNPELNVQFIANGLDAEQFNIDPHLRDQARSQWGITADEIVIGRVGRLCHKTKNYPLFLHAAATIAARLEKVKFVVVGNGPAAYLRNLKRLAKKLNIEKQVIFVEGHLDLTPIYNGLDILCSTSDTEGTPNVVIEAMACGVVCVVTDVGASRVVVGDLGTVVPPKDLTALNEALFAILEHLPQYTSIEYKEKLRAHMLKRYSHTLALQAHLKVLATLDNDL